MKNNIKNGIINTYNGLLIDLLNPTVDMINIDDIARGLAYKGHFGGMTPFYFSIAQHSTLVHELMLCKFMHNKQMLLLGLLHDASEAYIGDMVKPLKVHLNEFCEIEDRLMKVICEKFDVDYEMLSLVKPYDKEAQELEFQTFFEGAAHVISQTPDYSKRIFLRTFARLS